MEIIKSLDDIDYLIDEIQKDSDEMVYYLQLYKTKVLEFKEEIYRLSKKEDNVTP